MDEGFNGLGGFVAELDVSNTFGSQWVTSILAFSVGSKSSIAGAPCEEGGDIASTLRLGFNGRGVGIFVGGNVLRCGEISRGR